VVERPVEERVDLRRERVEVERRPVDRPVEPGDPVFEEKVIEASERGEEAVVSKEARVVEEVGLRKEADTRTETVRDTVREQKVDVEDDRTGRGAGGVVREERASGTEERVGTDEGRLTPEERAKSRI
jgi:stress response protein YsnF